MARQLVVVGSWGASAVDEDVACERVAVHRDTLAPREPLLPGGEVVGLGYLIVAPPLQEQQRMRKRSRYCDLVVCALVDEVARTYTTQER